MGLSKQEVLAKVLLSKQKIVSNAETLAHIVYSALDLLGNKLHLVVNATRSTSQIQIILIALKSSSRLSRAYNRPSNLQSRSTVTLFK